MAKKAATRDFCVGYELGFDPSSSKSEELAGDNEAREKQATEIKEGIVAICREAGGRVIREDRHEQTYFENEGEEDEGEEIEEFEAKPSTDRCVGCHSAQTVDWSKAPVNNCFDCHKGHTLKFHNAE